MPKLVLVYWLLILAFVGIVAFIITKIAHDQAQVFVILLFIFLDNSNVITNNWGVGRLVSLAFLI